MSRTFFIAGEQKTDAAGMVRMSGDKGLDRGDHGGERALHVRGAAPVEDAILNVWHEGRMAPSVFRTGRHHIRMTGEAEQRTLVAAHRPEIADLAKWQRREREPGGRQARAQQIEAAGVGGGDRGAADQVAGERQRGRHRVHRHGRVSL